MQSTSNPLPGLLRASAGEIEALEAAMDEVGWTAVMETEQRAAGQLIDHIAWAWTAAQIPAGLRNGSTRTTPSKPG